MIWSAMTAPFDWLQTGAAAARGVGVAEGAGDAVRVGVGVGGAGVRVQKYPLRSTAEVFGARA